MASRSSPASPPVAAVVTFRQSVDDDEAVDSDDDVIVTSGERKAGDVIGLFDVVKRDFRCETAKIRNRARYEDREDDDDDDAVPAAKRKLSHIQEMKRKVSISLELKNNGVEELQNCNYRSAIKLFHHSLLYLKGLDPDEGVELEADGGKHLPRKMPDKLKEIKEKTEIDNYLNLAVCLMHKPKPPYEKIKEYSVRILNLQQDHVKALMRAGMACYHLHELELAQFYLQNARRYSTLHSDVIIGASRVHCHQCQKLYKPLLNSATADAAAAASSPSSSYAPSS